LTVTGTGDVDRLEAATLRVLLPPVAEMHDRSDVEEPLLAIDCYPKALDSQHLFGKREPWPASVGDWRSFRPEARWQTPLAIPAEWNK